MSFIIPSALLIMIGSIGGIFDFATLKQIMITWPLYAFLLPFIAFAVFALIQMIKSCDKLIEKEEFNKIQKKRKLIIWSYIFIAFSYSFLAIPVGSFNDFTNIQIILSMLFAFGYFLCANISLTIKFIEELNKLHQHIPTKYISITSIGIKTLFFTVANILGTCLLIVLSLKVLIWRHQNFPEQGITLDSLFVRILIVVTILGIAQIIPNLLISATNIKNINKIKKGVIQMGNKDLSEEIIISSRDEFREIADYQNILLSEFREILNILKKNTQQLNTSSKVLNTLSSTLYESSSHQAVSLEEIAASIEELLASISINSENASKSLNISVQTQEVVNEGQGFIQKTLENIEHIGKKIGKINEITEQTNILAINAYIEAVNAGEEGNGFRVIAREIRSLADNSKTSASSIFQLATQCTEFSQLSVQKTEELKDYIEKTTEMAGVVSHSSKEQAHGFSQINNTIQAFSHSAQAITNSSEKLSSTSQELVSNANKLSSMLLQFKF